MTLRHLENKHLDMISQYEKSNQRLIDKLDVPSQISEIKVMA